MTFLFRRVRVALILAACAACVTASAAGCAPKEPGAGGEGSAGGAGAGAAGPRLTAVNLNDPVRPVALPEGVALSGARNEWVSFTLQLADLPAGASLALRLRPPQFQSANASVPAAAFEAYQIFPMPVDVNRAGYVRHTGLGAGSRRLPRALVPVKSDDGLINLAALRDPAKPADPTARAAGAGGEPLLLWVDLHVPADVPTGQYAAACEVLDGQRVVSSVPLALAVYDFAIPDERHLHLAARVEWDGLVRHYPDRFETVRPHLLNRKEDRYAAAVNTLDELVSLAQRHRTAVVVPRLQPTVKWPAAQPPNVDWGDFDSVVTPWMSGEAFADKVPLKYWPLPKPDYLEGYDRQSRLQYWSQAVAHYDHNDWLDAAPLPVEKVTPGPPGPADGAELSALAAEMLAIHPRVRVSVPLEDDQIVFSGVGGDAGVDSSTTERVWSAAPGLVSAPPARRWPDGVARPRHWLRTDTPGLVPYVGAGGDERDVRLWAWTAFLRQARLIVWNTALPSHPDPARPADPNELTWFYPGEWFGMDEPVPTIQLKWLRRAQQDFEYLWLAKERGEVINTLVMAQLMAKPVEIQPGQAPDEVYALMSGTADPQLWTDVQQLLAGTILLRRPGQEVDPTKQHALYIQTLRWLEPQERPLLMGRTTEWSWDEPDAGAPRAGRAELRLKLGIDIYNASGNRPDQNTLAWTAVPPGWEVRPQPVSIPALKTYHVRREAIEARFDLDKVTSGARQPVEVTFTNGFTNRTTPLRMVLPVATCDRREGGRLRVDGVLDDWDDADLLQDGPLVEMLDRPALQKQELRVADTASKIYAGWTGTNLHVAFDLDGVAGPAGGNNQNFVNYQFRRAWGEDLCQLLIQPLDGKGRPGKVLHVVCKPNGSSWVERKLDPKLNAMPWQPIEGADIRFASRGEGGRWRGEVSIPWKAILDPADGRDGAVPGLLRFNFAQHRTATGGSASWCGPVDFGRDDALMGVLYLRDPDAPGMPDVAGRSGSVGGDGAN